MAGLNGMLNVARDGLMAQQASLDTTGQNVANVNTPGYAKRTTVLATRAGNGSAGGVDVVTFARDAAQLASRRVYSEAGKSGAADARASAMQTIESIVAPDAGGISDKLSAFFSSLTTLSSDGNNGGARATVLARAQDLASSFSETAGAINAQRATQLDDAKGVANEVNTSLANIAKLNGQIASAEAAGTPANDLRDSRDVEIRNVADRAGATAIEDAKGMMTVFIGGAAAVTGNDSRPMSVDLDPQGNLRMALQGNGGVPVDVTSRMSEGKLGGLREARDVDEPATLKQLDQLAYDVATQVNSVHRAGVGQDGVSGRNLFVQPAAVAGAAYSFAVDPAMVGNPKRLAASDTAGSLPAGGATALKLSKIASSSLAGAGTPGERIAGIVSDVGSRSASAQNEASLRASTVQTAETNFESERGVSLDEEMVNLTRFQHAFEASTKILQTANELLGDLIKAL